MDKALKTKILMENFNKYLSEDHMKEEDAKSYYKMMRWYFGIFETMEEYKPFGEFSEHIVVVTDLIDDMQKLMQHDWSTNVDVNLIDTYKELKYRLKNLKQLINEMPSDGNNQADALKTIKEFEEWLIKVNEFTNWQFTDGKPIYESRKKSKNVILENNTDVLELNKYARELYSILKKNGIEVSIYKDKSEIKSNNGGAGESYISTNYAGSMPYLHCCIIDIRKISKDVGNKILNDIKTWLPKNLDQKTQTNGWNGEQFNIYFRIKPENRTEKTIADRGHNRL